MFRRNMIFLLYVLGGIHVRIEFDCMVLEKYAFSSKGKKRRANHRDIGRCGQGQLLDRRQPLGSPRCAETRPPSARRHDSGLIGKTSPPIQDEPAPPVFALHLDAAENNWENESRTWVTRNTKSFPNHFTTTSLAVEIYIKSLFSMLEWCDVHHMFN
ncbi:hypothetical protein HanPI659440_Chr05g0215021 [Helianthus annuus]|nr:hypothetical protein HanPI659440_Chr05g0215021 [Helianthus annuus]